MVDIAMDEEDINSGSEVEELPVGFFHTTETFPEEVSEAAPDQHVAGVSMTKRLSGNNIKPGSSGAGERQDLPSSSRRRSRSPSSGYSRSGSCHSSMRCESRHSRSKKKESSKDSK